MRNPRIGAILVLCAALVAVGAAAAGRAADTRTDGVTLTGAGSTLVAPLISVWTQPLGQAFGYQLEYGAVGSGAGISSISSRTVDFGTSDAPMSADQLAGCNGCVQIPWALSATTLSYDIKGVPTDLHLDGPAIAGIFSGAISRWNDPRIAKQNPKLGLPNEPITPVFRSDPSGDTYAFTDYLSHVSPAWKSKYGSGTAVAWPAGIGEKGNAGVAGAIASNEGSIGYVSVAYALTNHLHVAAIKNGAGRYATPGLRAIAAAAALVKKVPAGNRISIVDPGKAAPFAYPISTFTYVILPLKTSKAAELRKFVFWGMTQGQTYGPRLIFARLPTVVLVAAEKTLKKVRPAT